MQSHASFWEAVKGALHSLRGNKLRSFLTLLGIILATTTLIAVMSVISGMDLYIAQNVSSMGADGYRVQRIVMMGFDPKKYMEMLRRNPNLSKEEYDFLRSNVTIARDIKDKFFPETSAVGRQITLDGLPFEVVGVAKAKGSVFGQSQDNFVMIPFETYAKIWGLRNGMNFAA